MMEHLLEIVALFFTLFWIATAALATWHRKTARIYLNQLANSFSSAAPVSGAPSLSVVIAARNEGAGIRRAVESLLDQVGVGELIVVNDRSTDSTGSVLEELASSGRPLKVVHIANLPDGWLGKNHALEKGWRMSRGDIVLFTDGDVVFKHPHVVGAAARWMTENGRDHVTAFPEVPLETFGETLFMAMFNVAFVVRFPSWLVESRHFPVGMGVGAFNLFRRSTLEKVGGLANLRMSLDDDMRLGLAVKCAGLRSKVLMGKDAVFVRWQSGGLWSYIKGLEKNFFASVDFSLVKSVSSIVGLTIVTLFTWIGVLCPSQLHIALSALQIGAIAWIYRLGSRETGVTPWFAFAMPLGGLVLNLAHVNSIIMTYRNGGVRWRDHVYTLDTLRRHCRERNRWLWNLWWKRDRCDV